MFRFGHLFDNSEHVLASATNPRYSYKLGRWLDWLPSIDASYIRTKTERSIQLVSQDKECCSSEESEESGMESVEDQLFQNLYDKPSKR